MNKLSVIIPAYNVEKYIEKCIESVINQSYKNLEIIIINDGSTDHTDELCKKYIDKDARIKYISKENEGLSEARNTGLRYATGDYVTFLDSDDYFDLNYASIMMKEILDDDLDMVSCNSRSFNDYDGKEYPIPIKINKVFNNIEALDDINTKESFTFEPAQQKIYKKELFNDLKFEKGRIHEDTIMCVKYYYKISKGKNIDIPLYNYRVRNGSISRTKFNIKSLDNLYAYKSQVHFFQEVGYKNINNSVSKFYSMWIYDYFRAKKNNVDGNDAIFNELERYYNDFKQYLPEQKIGVRVFMFFYEKMPAILNMICNFVLKVYGIKNEKN